MSAASIPSPLYPVYRQRWDFSVEMLTVVFATYVVGLLGALLTVGSLSDRLGRRPVLVAASLLAAASTFVFSTADGVTGLLAARLVQGIATGTATGALASAMVEFEPASRPGLGSTLTGAVTGAGLATGSALGGVLVATTARPDHYLFPALTLAFLSVGAALTLIPENGTPPHHARWRLRPRLAVPESARRAFLGTVPTTIAGWAATGLFLALVPSLMRSVLHVRFAAAGGLSIAALYVAVTAGGLRAGRLSARVAVWRGAVLLAIGALGLAVSFACGSAVALGLSAIPAGLGVGMTFTGNLHELGAATTRESRAQVYSAAYVVSYAALSLSALVAGFAVPWVGLRASGVLYATVVGLLALVEVVPTSPARARRCP